VKPEDVLAGLRAALDQSPDNVPLREQFAALLLSSDRVAEAEAEYRETIARGGGDSAHLGLARAFLAAGKLAEALVVAEGLADADQAAAASLLLARILLERGELDAARERYTQAVARDPALSDEGLASMLSVVASEDEPTRIALGAEPPSVGAGSEPAEDTTPTDRKQPVTFADVGGMDDLKDEIRMKIAYPLTHPELFGAYGKEAGGGILLYGPPGCGKTYLARATAGEIEADFIAIGIDEVLGMYLGESEQQLHDAFERARRAAPCVLFFDELDALGARRSDVRTSAVRQLVNQLLAEMDGVSSSNSGVLVLGATNAPWHVDDALRRPGRFDRVVFVPPPDRRARVAILEVLLAGKPVADVDVSRIARQTEGFSGADLRALVERAVESRLRDSMRSGVPLPLGTDELLAARGTARPTTAEWMQTARSYALHANQAGSYDDVLAYLGKKR
jgi:tetratricopeptide (TPR) repeat protein